MMMLLQRRLLSGYVSTSGQEAIVPIEGTIITNVEHPCSSGLADRYMEMNA